MSSALRVQASTTPSGAPSGNQANLTGLGQASWAVEPQTPQSMPMVSPAQLHAVSSQAVCGAWLFTPHHPLSRAESGHSGLHLHLLSTEATGQQCPQLTHGIHFLWPPMAKTWSLCLCCRVARSRSDAICDTLVRCLLLCQAILARAAGPAPLQCPQLPVPVQ